MPALRFRGFYDAWEQRNLENEVISIGTGRSDSTSGIKKSREFLFPVLGSTSVISYDNKYDYSGEFVLTARVGANAGNLYKYKGNVKISDNTVYIQATNLNFIFYLLMKFNVKKLSFGTGQPLVKASELKKLNLYFPINGEEQKKIGSLFNQLENLITQNERKIDLLKQLKQAYLQKIFNQELRFTGFSDDWEERDLSAISDKVTEKNKENQFSETFTNSAEYGIINQRDFFDKDISNEKNLNGYYIVHENDFVYNPRISNYAPVGPIKRNKLGRTGVMSPLYYVFRSRGVDKKYLEYYFDTTAWHIFLKMNGDSGARSDRFAIKDSVFNQMPISYPTIGEQEQIGSFFEKLDKAIPLHQQKLNLLKKQKQAYLQKMFI